jgi:DNA-binding response OmpR family regulator
MMKEMSSPSRHVLILGADAPELERFVPLLRRGGFTVHRSESVEGASSLIQATAFDLIVVGHPLPGHSLGQLLLSTRDRASPNRKSGLLVVAASGSEEEANVLLGRGVNRVVPLNRAPALLLDAVADLLEVAPRVAVRSLVELKMDLEVGSGKVLSRTENLSRTGMLVREALSCSIGTAFRFELLLPKPVHLISGSATVVRHTDLDREGVRGFGGRFTDLDGDGRHRLVAYLESELRRGADVQPGNSGTQ